MLHHQWGHDLLQRHSTAFQDFFVALGHHRWGADFEGRRPQGKLGDGKCDGYHVPTETVFQCYAPRQMEARVLRDKIEEDFNGAIANRRWTPLKKWSLVHNDFDDLPLEAHQLIISLRHNYKGDVDITITGPHDILILVSETPIERLRLLFPEGISQKDLQRISYRDIDSLIASIGQLDEQSDFSAPDAPSLRKIEHNGFSEAVSTMLKLGSLSERKFVEFFSQTSRVAVGDRLAERFKQTYITGRAEAADNDELFFKLTQAAGGLDCDKRRRAAIMGLIAYLFRTCEIFENAPASLPS